MVRKEKLEEEELSLKEKYALLRKQRQQQQQQQQQKGQQQQQQHTKQHNAITDKPLSPKKETPKQKSSPDNESDSQLTNEVVSLNDKAKIELAKKALALSLQKESQKETCSKRRVPTKSQKKESSESLETSKRQKIENEPETISTPKQYSFSRDRRDKRNMILADEVVEGEYYPTTIFVGDLPEGISETELEKHFSPFGHIECIRLITTKNFAFIKFNNREGADQAISNMNATTIYNLPIRVSKARIHTAQHTWRKSWDGWSIQDKHNVTSQSFEAPVAAPPTVYTPPPLPTPSFNTDGRVALETPRGSEYSDTVRNRILLHYDDL